MDLPLQGDVPKQQLSQAVASYVREMIISGHVRRGAFLRIDSLAKAMKTSSTPVREGLLILQSEGFVRLEPRRGFMVVGFTRQDVRDIFWAQATLGGELAARAAALASPELHAELTRLVAAYDEAVAAGDETQTTRLGHLFHRAINLASPSRRLAIMLGSMTKQLPNRLYGMIDGQVKGAQDYHPLIAAAIVAGQAEEARRLMTEHMIEGGEFLVRHLDAQGIWADESPGKSARNAA